MNSVTMLFSIGIMTGTTVAIVAPAAKRFVDTAIASVAARLRA